MRKFQIFLTTAAAVVASVILWSTNSDSGSTWITNTKAVEPATGLKATVQFRRAETDLIVELKNFPSFRSQFKQPSISTTSDGSVTVSLESSSSGFFSNKSEQLTHISMKIPSTSIPSQRMVSFRSDDYDQVIVSGVAP